MKTTATFAILFSLSLSMLACSTAPSRVDQGVFIGGIVGGIIGHQVGRGSGRTIATMVGAVTGAAIGGSIGRSMDDTDRLRVAHTLETVRTDVPATWINPDSGYAYAVTPTRTYESGTGPCREYTLDATIGGETQHIFGIACRQADGSWQVQN